MCVVKDGGGLTHCGVSRYCRMRQRKMFGSLAGLPSDGKASLQRDEKEWTIPDKAGTLSYTSYTRGTIHTDHKSESSYLSLIIIIIGHSWFVMYEAIERGL